MSLLQSEPQSPVAVEAAWASGSPHPVFYFMAQRVIQHYSTYLCVFTTQHILANENL